MSASNLPNQPEPDHEQSDSYEVNAYPIWEPTSPMSNDSPTGPYMTGNASQVYEGGAIRSQAEVQTYVDQQGNIVQQQTVTYLDDNQRRANLRSTLLTISSLLTVALIALLWTRFFFRLLGADPSNGIVSFIYHLSSPFLLGFNGILADFPVGQYGVFETGTVIAIVMYLILAAGVQAVIKAVLAPRHAAQRTSTRTQTFHQ